MYSLLVSLRIIKGRGGNGMNWSGGIDKRQKRYTRSRLR